MATVIPSSGPEDNDAETNGPGAVEVLAWLGQGKRLIAKLTVVATLVAVGVAFLIPPVFTARTSLLLPGAQQQSGSAAALAALGQLGGASQKTPDELYVALLKSDSVITELDTEFKLRDRYKAKSFVKLRRAVLSVVRVTSDKKSGVITVEVDDQDPAFAAQLANAHVKALTRMLSRLAVGEAKQRRIFYEEQLKETKENLIEAEQNFRKLQESSGVIVLDKQAEAMIGSASTLRAQIAAREVQMKVLRTGATEQNPEVMRLSSELRALRGELARIESSGATAVPGAHASLTEMPVGKIPEAAVDFVRARRELKLQETLLEGMVRQFELAKLEEAKEGPLLQQIDLAVPPDLKSKPSRLLIVVAGGLLGLLASSAWVLGSGLIRHQKTQGPQAWRELREAWRWKKA